MAAQRTARLLHVGACLVLALQAILLALAHAVVGDAGSL